MGLGNTTITDALKHLFKVSTWTAPANVYVALSTANPGASGSGMVEVTGGSYARVQHQTGTNWVASAGLDNQYENNNAITFATATAGWGTITHFALYDASTVGNFLAFGTLTTAKTVANGDTLSFADGELKVSVTSTS